MDQYALKKGPVRKVPFRRGLTETSEPNPPPSFSEAKLVNSGYSENMLLKFVSMDRPPNLGYESFLFFSSLQPKLCTPVYDLIQGWPPAVGLILFPFGLSDNSNSMREAAYKSQQWRMNTTCVSEPTNSQKNNEGTIHTSHQKNQKVRYQDQIQWPTCQTLTNKTREQTQHFEIWSDLTNLPIFSRFLRFTEPRYHVITF